MKDGFIKVAAASPAIKIADTEQNAISIINCIKEAAGYGVKLICFPELCITGSSCGDLFISEVLQNGVLSALEKIRASTTDFDMVIVVGCPVKRHNKLYNCTVALSKGKYLAVVPKENLKFPNSRWFSAYGGENEESPFGVFGKNIILECSSMPQFTIGFDMQTTNGTAIIVQPAAENETPGFAAKRRSFINANSERLSAGYIYAGAGDGESTTDYAYSGHRIIAENGIILNESGLFDDTKLTISEIDVKMLYDFRLNDTAFKISGDTKPVMFDLIVSDTTLTRKFSKTPFIPGGLEYNEYLSSTLSIQANGIKTRFLHTGAFKLVIGVSGGRDSALALVACVNAMDILKLPRTDVIGISMPCFGTTEGTKSAAFALCEALGVTFKEIDIGKSVESHLKDIDHDLDNHNTTYENSQARERTQLLMDYANDVNGIVIGTGDLSELALGWATYGGDHMAMYGVNGSVPKTLISDLLYYYANTSKNDRFKSAVDMVFQSPISPELLPAAEGEIKQITEDIVGPYILHDFFLYYAFRGFMPQKILRLAKYAFDGDFTDEVILKWLKNFYTRFFMSQFKRSCSPDGVMAGVISLSPRGGLVMPSDASANLWLASLEQ